jgi:hypothetical protein
MVVKLSSVTLRKEHILNVFENRVLRRTHGLKRDDIIGYWRKLHNEGFYNLYTSPDISLTIESKRIGWAGHVAHMGEEKGRALQGFDEKARGKEITRKT